MGRWHLGSWLCFWEPTWTGSPWQLVLKRRTPRFCPEFTCWRCTSLTPLAGICQVLSLFQVIFQNNRDGNSRKIPKQLNFIDFAAFMAPVEGILLAVWLYRPSEATSSSCSQTSEEFSWISDPAESASRGGLLLASSQDLHVEHWWLRDYPGANFISLYIYICIYTVYILYIYCIYYSILYLHILEKERYT